MAEKFPDNVGKYRENFQNEQFVRIVIDDSGRLYKDIYAKFPKIRTGNNI